jgi:hypothetical protein
MQQLVYNKEQQVYNTAREQQENSKRTARGTASLYDNYLIILLTNITNTVTNIPHASGCLCAF